MDSSSEQTVDRELEKPPTLVAESGRGKISGTGMATIADDKSAKMPVLQPNVNIIGTRTKSGRIHKPARNFSSDEYVVPTLIKRRIPNNSRVTVTTRSYSKPTPKDPVLSKVRGGSKASSSSITIETNNELLDANLRSVGNPSQLGMDDFAGEEVKEEMFDDLESALVNESKRKVGSNSMVDALHATLQKDGGPQFDPSQYEPPALEKDGTIFGLDDMEVEHSSNSCNFFIEEPGFGNADTPTGLTDDAFAELDQDQDMDEKPDVDDLLPDDSEQSSESSIPDNVERLDLDGVEIEESSGNVKITPGTDAPNLGETMISTKTALMCALKISEDFLPSSHEKYMNRLEESEKYPHEELDDIRRKFNMKPSTLATKRKLLMESDVSKKAKVALKVMNNGVDKPRPHPYLRSAYAKCRKFMEDETTVIEKLGNNKILAAGRVIEINYENYLKESDVELPYDDTSGPMPSLPPPTASNCHAPCCRLGCICNSISEDMPPRKHCGRPKCFFECNCQNILFNSSDDGDIRSRLRPRVSLLNWRAESTEKEKEPMTSYRQMERGTHFIRAVRRAPAQPERLRRDFVLDGKVVERNPSKVAKERLRTKALLQSSHRRIMATKPEGLGHGHGHSHRFMRIVTPKVEHKPKVNIEQMKKKCTPITVDVEHMNVVVSEVRQVNKAASPPKPDVRQLVPPPPPAQPVSKLTAKDVEEIKSIIQEMTEDCQLLALDDIIGFFSWAKGMVHPKVTMYQVMRGDEFKVPWLYLPIPPPGYSWICHYLTSSFEKSDYVYIPEIKCCISSQALRVNMNTAFLKKKTVYFDVKTEGATPGVGKIYFFPDLAKVLVCGPFKTDQTTINPRDIASADKMDSALQHMDKLRLLQRFGGDRSWKRFTSTPTIYPIKKRTDNETVLSAEESRKLFAQIYPSILDVKTGRQFGLHQAFKQPIAPKIVAPKPVVSWSDAVKFVALGGGSIPTSSATSNASGNLSFTEIIALNL